jgi:hypothetical protein
MHVVECGCVLALLQTHDLAACSERTSFAKRADLAGLDASASGTQDARTLSVFGCAVHEHDIELFDGFLFGRVHGHLLVAP